MPIFFAGLVCIAIGSACAAGETPPNGNRPDADDVETREGGDVEPAEDAGEDGSPDAEASACTSHEDCEDGIDCTIDTCDPATWTCKRQAVAAICDDGNPCTGMERCDVVLGCLAEEPVDCGDGIDCTVDECDPLTAGCRNTADHARCPPPMLCDPARRGCVDPPACATDPDCSDGDGCNGAETCGPDSRCRPGVAVVCDDRIPCTADRCIQETGNCAFEPNHAACADADQCNGTEVCDPASGCRPGTPVRCDDGIACTGDSCDPTTGRCMISPNNASCSNGVFCDGNEWCDARSGCAPGEPPACDDAIGCTADRCDRASDRCINVPDHSACSDGLFCNGSEECRAGTGCVAGAPPVCNDGIGCTTDRCDPAANGGAGGCVFTQPDRDGDTYADSACMGADCDDLNPLINPASPESCNAVDDDCDGLTDETFACVRDSTATCGTPCGSSGTQRCSNTCTWGSCAPPGEICNGRDDDCVSGCDNGFACCLGATETQSCGLCATQTRTCVAGCTWSAWGSCAGGGECAPGATETRLCPCGGSESRGCSGICMWGPWSGCVAGACTPGSTQNCTTTCSSTGRETCSASCTWGACVPPAEVCNGADDDCDTACDNGFRTSVINATYTALATHHPPCNGSTQRIGPDCNAAIHRFCGRRGCTTSGFGPVENFGDYAAVVCLSS
ncbi:MAG: MopE-related protein [Myxococcota bacterium]|nr:MopE-related protein [Myxococcota bacterium]